jgi:glutaminyl-tRNA synthetase
LRYAFFITCQEVVKNDAGEIVEVRCTYDPATRGGDAPDGRKVQGTIHWVSASRGVTCEVRLYDKLFTVPDPEAQGDDLDFTTLVNPDSIRVMSNAKVEPSVLGDAPDARYQFERTGYFVKDVADWSDERPVFNRTVTLRDTWAKVKGA